MRSFIALCRKRKLVLFGALSLLVLTTLALFGPILSPYDAGELDVPSRLLSPSVRHWCGTDEFGRDMFTRVVEGGRWSMLIGALVVAFSTGAGVLIGLCAGFFPRLDAPLMRVVDALMSFPDILLAIALVATLGASVRSVVLALSIVYTPRVARVVRAATLVVREMLFVEAARALGVSTIRIAFVHVLGNMSSPILVQASFIFAYAMLAEAGLSFLGMGVPPEVPTWGAMVASGQAFTDQAIWLVLFPGLAIMLAAVSLQMVGDGLRDMLDPRLRKSL